MSLDCDIGTAHWRHIYAIFRSRPKRKSKSKGKPIIKTKKKGPEMLCKYLLQSSMSQAESNSQITPK